MPRGTSWAGCLAGLPCLPGPPAAESPLQLTITPPAGGQMGLKNGGWALPNMLGLPPGGCPLVSSPAGRSMGTSGGSAPGCHGCLPGVVTQGTWGMSKDVMGTLQANFERMVLGRSLFPGVWEKSPEGLFRGALPPLPPQQGGKPPLQPPNFLSFPPPSFLPHSFLSSLCASSGSSWRALAWAAGGAPHPVAECLWGTWRGPMEGVGW